LQITEFLAQSFHNWRRSIMGGSIVAQLMQAIDPFMNGFPAM